jgi:hypothetical protein
MDPDELELLENTFGNQRYRTFDEPERANQAAREMEQGRIIILASCFVVTGVRNARKAAKAGLDVVKKF